VMFPQSESLMRERFAESDPRRPHPYRRSALKVWIPDLVHTAPVYAGVPIEVIGRVVEANVFAPVSEKAIEWILQLAPLTTDGGLVYCRVTVPLARRVPAGTHVVARGTVVGAGTISLSRGGFADGAYMACSAVGRPYGEMADFTTFLERSGIDVVALHRRARTEQEYSRLLHAALKRAVRRDPSLLAIRR
jgi:hypothetical protein